MNVRMKLKGISSKEVKMGFKCECLKCGHKFDSFSHCMETKCPKCGGDTRRESRPGPGQ